MTPAELKKIRLMQKVTLLELAAYTGIPQGYLQQLEEEKFVALASDLERIEKALREIATKAKTVPEQESLIDRLRQRR